MLSPWKETIIIFNSKPISPPPKKNVLNYYYYILNLVKNFVEIIL